jgi:hypothetical protein
MTQRFYPHYSTNLRIKHLFGVSYSPFLFTEYCNVNSISFNTNNYCFYQEQNINLYHYYVSERTSIAILENTLDNTYIILRKEKTQLANGKSYQIYSFLENKLITPFPIIEEPSNKPNAPKTYPENYNPNQPCNAQGYSFSECAECGWADLNSSMTGALACTFNPQICWAAVGIHCALGSPLYQPGGSTYPSSYQLNNNVLLIN